MRKIGLLGGTFNYAHYGHLYVSKVAMKKLNLSEIWWLVCKHNPLKIHNSIQDRLCYAKYFLSSHQRIKVFPVDDFVTYSLLLDFKKRFKGDFFVWLMGVDNLVNLHTWDNADKICSLAPIVIFDRGKVLYKALKGRFAVKNRYKFSGVNFCTKGWMILRVSKNDLSSTSFGHRMV